MKKGQSPRVWTNNDIDCMKLVYDGTRESMLVIAEMLETTIENVRSKIKRLGFYLKLDKKQIPWSEEEIQTLKLLYETHTTAEISKTLGRGKGVIENAITKYIKTKNGWSKPRRKKILRGWQQCSCCGISKTLDQFHEIKRCECKECRNKSRRESRQKKLENMSVLEREEYNRVRNEKNRNYWNNSIIAKIATKVSKLKRREREKNLASIVKKTDLIIIQDKFGNRCFNCGRTNKLCVDHHYPLSKGFALCEDNAVILCKSCNSSKGSKQPEEFYTTDKLIELKVRFGIDVKSNYGGQ